MRTGRKNERKMNIWSNSLVRRITPEWFAVFVWFFILLCGFFALTTADKVGFGWENLIFLGFVFSIQLITGIILGKCFANVQSHIHRTILIAVGIIHGLWMLRNMFLLWELRALFSYEFFIFTLLFLITGFYLMLLGQRGKGISIALFSLAAWCQPLILSTVQQ